MKEYPKWVLLVELGTCYAVIAAGLWFIYNNWPLIELMSLEPWR